jgi:hypothetical protein
MLSPKLQQQFANNKVMVFEMVRLDLHRFETLRRNFRPPCLRM